MVVETPDVLLGRERVTPANALFVRNHHGGKPFLSMDPRPLEGQLELAGLVRNPQVVPLQQLAAKERTEVEMVLQCTGNFRSLFSKLAPAKGSQWGKGGVGNVRFAGVPIAAFFKAINLELDPKAKFITAEGADQPEKPEQHDFEKSIPLDVALSRGLLATHLNGAPIPAVHGGPLRLVIPGYYGSMQVKWLTKLRLEAEESKDYYQAVDYRTPNRLLKPGEPFTAEPANSSPAADMKINTRIFAPLDGAQVRASAPVIVKGVAWNDGAAPITSVELSLDQGRTWVAAVLSSAASPYAFREWKGAIELGPGRHELWSRAVDALGRTQPLDGSLLWNPSGYAWNAVERVTITAA
jgi:DMSO/TMAO reductase YedYZ molybdopterin-dependent catalytic subunit